MTAGAVIVTWGSPVRGREAKALEVFTSALSLMEDLAKQGRIHGHKEFLAVTGNAQALSGYQIIEGEFEELLKLQADDRFRRLQTEAATIVDNFTVTLSIGGSDQAISGEMARYVETMQGLGFF